MNASIPFPRVFARAGAPLAAALLLLATTAPAAAQNNDDDGVLPGQVSYGSGTAPGQTGQPMTSSEFMGLTLSEEPAAVELDPGQATVELESEAVAVQAGSPDADVLPVDGHPLQGEFEPEEGRLRLQDDVLLDLHAGVDGRLTAAEQAQLRVSILLLDAGTPLDWLLSGAVPPLVAHVVGDVPSLDLHEFQGAVEYYGQGHPGLRVTWVNASLDLEGELHLLAVRASTDGGPLEIAAR